MSYAQLVYAGNMADPEIGKFYQSCQERVTGISSALVFFVLELNQIEDAALAERLKTPCSGALRTLDRRSAGLSAASALRRAGACPARKERYRAGGLDAIVR